MMDYINILFRILDFCVIVGVVIYAGKYYIIPMVEKLLREYGVFVYNLESDCKNVQIQTQSIYEDIQDQERQFQLMQHRFAVWQNICNERNALQQAEQEKIDEFMQQRFKMQSEGIQKNRIMKQEFPAILDATTKKLQQKYQGSVDQKEYIEALIDVMKEKP